MIYFSFLFEHLFCRHLIETKVISETDKNQIVGWA